MMHFADLSLCAGGGGGGRRSCFGGKIQALFAFLILARKADDSIIVVT